MSAVIIRSQIESKNNEISRLREVTAQLRGELSTKIAREINEAENVQRIKVCPLGFSSFYGLIIRFNVNIRFVL